MRSPSSAVSAVQSTLPMAEEERSHDLHQRRHQRSRLLPRLASLAIRYADFLVVTSCISGLIAILLLPALAKSTYISENALIPGSASPKFAIQNAFDAAQLARELRISTQNSTNSLLAIQKFLVHYLLGMGAHFYLHPFDPPEPPFSSVDFFSSNHLIRDTRKKKRNYKTTFERLGKNLVGILRAPRGEGNEAIVLVTPFDAERLTDSDAISLGLGLALFNLLSNAPWLAKDIIWLAADSRYGPHSAVAAWLKDYYEPTYLWGQNFEDSVLTSKLYDELSDSNDTSMTLDKGLVGGFQRAGIITAGIVFSMQDAQKRAPSDSLTVYGEGPNGQMPNLDLVNVVNNLAVYREGLLMQVDIVASMLEWGWLQVVGQVLEKVGQIASRLNAGWKFGLPFSEYVQGAATLTCSISRQALGVPTGAHGAFRDYQIDAVTLVMSHATEGQGGYIGSLIKFGRLLEGVIRSVNNLLEKFHQSFFLYLLTAPNKFVSVGVYIVPLLLLIITLPLKAAALCTCESESSLEGQTRLLSKLSEEGETSQKNTCKESDQGLVSLMSVSERSLSIPGHPSSFSRWALGVLTVCLIELWGFLVAMCPPLALYLAESAELKVALWIVFSCVSLSLLLVFLSKMASSLRVSQSSAASFSVGGNWTAVKASTLGAATIGIGVMSSINFAAALAGAVFLVPMCLSVYPLQYLQQKKCINGFLAVVVGLTFTLISSPPVLLFFILTMLAESFKESMIMMWEWVEFMWQWESATYLYFFLVHLPCSVVCILLLSSNPN